LCGAVCVYGTTALRALRPLQEDARKREELLPQYHFQYVKVRRMCAVPAQMWHGVSPVPVQMWRGEPSPGADVAGASPVAEQMWQG
jgi:hypothetical protein